MSESHYVARYAKPEAIERLSREHGASWPEYLLARDTITVELTGDMIEAERQAHELANQHQTIVSLWEPSDGPDDWPYTLVRDFAPGS